VASGPTTTDPAARKAQVDRERNRLAEQYDETLSAEADLVSAFEQSRATAAELARQLTVLDEYSAAIQQELDLATSAANQAVLRRDAFREDLRGATLELYRRRQDLRATAVSGYVWFGERGTVRSAYGQAVVADEQLVSGFYAGYLDDVQGERIDAVEQQEARVSDLTAQAVEASEKAEGARQQMAQTRAELQRARDEQAVAKAAADAEVERQQQLVAQVEAKRADYQQRLRSLQAESAQLGELLRARQAAAAPAASTAKPASPKPSRPKPAASAPPAAQAPTPKPTSKPKPTAAPAPAPSSGGAPGTTAPAQTPTTNNAGAGPPPNISVQLGYPLPGYPIVSKYGWRVHPILGVRKLHEGIDIWAPAGTPIHAAASGTVIWSGPRNGYGNAVIIDHGSGVGTVYAHQSAVAVSPGQSVGRGEVIGYVGQTGLAAGPHLHFEVRVGGRTYDPLAYVSPG
jgi:murein DD-endopeptidase MepM/ murein hydrolase activator NlpD